MLLIYPFANIIIIIIIIIIAVTNLISSYVHLLQLFQSTINGQLFL